MEDACSTERPTLAADEWCTFRTKSGEFTSKCSIKQNFLDEMKANNRKLHVNKKNPTKSLRYYQDITRTPRSNDITISSGQKDDHIFQTSIPNTITYTHEGLGSRIYNCKFTSDGKRILVTSQRGTSFFKFAEDGNVELSSVISCHNINWTITDSDISSDNKFMVHSTLSPNVHMFDLEKANYAGQFNLRTGNQVDEDDDDDDHYGHSWFYSLRIYSLKISQDNNEIIAGCGRIGQGAPIQVYDLERKRVKNSIMAHDEDINSVCYLDRRNSSIVISGSDDGLCKIWDTRILQDNRPVGIFYGHVCGLTCVNSKEDDRYFISNSKDQTIKLWDIRKSSTDKKSVTMHDYDYRYSSVNVASLDRYRSSMKTNDQSVMTFTGHKVHMTLIRCHFSPLYGTGQRYIYSGSYDGNVYIYDTVTGENIMKLELPKGDSYYSNSVVRDCAWHPYSQNFVSTSFYGEIHKWEYMDLRDGENLTANRRPSARVVSRPLVSSEGDDSDFRRANSDSEEADINDLP